MTYATTSDVETELGRSAASAAETARWQAWLDRVERTIERRFKRSGLVLADQVAAGDPVQQDVVDVEVSAVVRKIEGQALAGLTSITTSVDDGTVTKRRESGLDGDPLEPTFDEWAVLLPSVATGAFSTRPGFEPDGGTSAALDWA